MEEKGSRGEFEGGGRGIEEREGDKERERGRERA